MKRLLFSVLLILVIIVGCGPNSPLVLRMEPPVQNQPPVAYIDLISPAEVAPGQMVSFSGHGTDRDGKVVGYLWSSNLDGDLSTSASFQTSSLSTGGHIISLKVKDDFEVWSAEVSSSVTVSAGSEPPPPPPPPLVTTLPTIATFEADPEHIPSGTADLSWTVYDATMVVISPDVGVVSEDERFSSGSVTVSPAETTVYTLTAANEIGSVNDSVQVTVGYELRPPPSHEIVGPAAVTDVDIAGDGFFYIHNPCPLTIKWTGTITVNGPCTVTYQWRQHGTGHPSWAYGPTRSIYFPEAGRQTVTHTWIVAYSGYFEAQLITLTPNRMQSPESNVQANCSEQFSVTQVRATGSSASGARHCPCTINFSGEITVSGPGEVHYTWDGSDYYIGSYFPHFPAAGTYPVSLSWTVERSGTYWARLRTVTPNAMTASKQTVTVTCEISRGDSWPIGR